MHVKPALWSLGILLFWIIWPASALSALANGLVGSSGCVDNTWTTTSTVGAPSARADHTAVWTGTEMLVWGGYDRNGHLNTGGRYDPATDTWAAISTEGAPSARIGHSAVWTGTEMLVWGGYGYSGGLVYYNTGGRYDLMTDTWSVSPTDGAPSPRAGHTAVWTGTEMIVWGGRYYDYDLEMDVSLNTGGRYCASASKEDQ